MLNYSSIKFPEFVIIKKKITLSKLNNNNNNKTTFKPQITKKLYH